MQAHGDRVVHDCGVPALKEPELDEILAFCAEDPVERVFLEDIARRGLGRFTALARNGHLTALCHAGANLVPSGGAAAPSPSSRDDWRARMIIGEQGAVTELWDAASPRLPPPREDRPGQPVYVLDEAPEPGDRVARGHAGRLRSASAGVCGGPPGGDRNRSARPGPRGVPLADARADRRGALLALGRGRNDPLQGRSLRLDAARSPAATGLVDPEVRGHGYAQRGLRDLCRLLLPRVPTVCLFVRRDNAVAIRVYEAVGMRHTISYRSLIF